MKKNITIKRLKSAYMTVLITLTVGFLSACSSSEGVISWEEASAHIGERLTVEGEVIGTKYVRSSRGKPTFLNMGNSYPNPNRFTVVIWGDDRSGFSDDPESYYKGKRIRVKGTIEVYKGVPQIVVKEQSSIEVVE